MKKLTRVLNLTQHDATHPQKMDGVYEPRCKEAIKNLITFKSQPSDTEIELVASTLAEIASEHEAADAAMIGGAQYLLAPLEAALLARGVEAWYAHTERRSIEIVQSDGSIKKISEFIHEGFVKRRPKK